MNHSLIRTAASSRGSALLIILAFLLLLTTVTVAFLSRATFERQLSNASYSQGKVDLAGQGAVAAIIGDLQQEIVAGSNVGAGTTIPDLTQGGTVSGYYYPNSPATVVPAIVGFTPATGVEDLLKISKNGYAFYSGGNYNTTTYPAPSRAAPVSTGTASLNNRSISNVRWNKPLLMNPINVATSPSDFTPPAAFTSNPPDWIYVARDGSNPIAWDSSYKYLPSVAPTTPPASGTPGHNPVTQRYAYAIYDEGSTLDMNVAGSPSQVSGVSVGYSTIQPYKNALAYADLTQLPGISSLTAANRVAFVNAIVGWRNYASAQATAGAFPGVPTAYTFTGATAPSVLTPFDFLITQNMSGFLNVGNTAVQVGPNVTGSGNQTDNAFTSRQQLLQFFLQGLGQNTAFTANVPLPTLESVLPYLGTFSRDINQPSYGPNPKRPVVLPAANGGNNAVGVDALVNPSFLNITATTSFTRNDGSAAIIGEPLVKKRFALNRLAWITYKGPSAGRTMSDPDMAALIADGIPQSYLLQGTAANIQNYFGLAWDAGKFQWDYNVHNGSSGTGPSGAIMQLGKIATLGTRRDPDFFELLKATIGVGSLGKALAYSNSAAPIDPGGVASQPEQPYNYNYYAENSVDYHILQIGANIIAQFQPANFPPQILFDDGSGRVPRAIVGVENLPYLSMVTNGVMQLKTPVTSNPITTSLGPQGSYGATTSISDPGVGAWMQEPVIWNPHDPSSPPGVVGPTKLRVVAASGSPDGTFTSKFFVYGGSIGLAAGSNYSNNAVLGSTYSSGGLYADPNGNGIGIAHQFSVNNSAGADTCDAEIDLTGINSAPTKELCPEPVILMKPKAITDSNGNTFTVSVPLTAWMNQDPATSASGVRVGGGLNDLDILATPYGNATPPYIGFYLGAFPWAWTPATPAAGATKCSTFQSGVYLARAGGAIPGTIPPGPAGSPHSCYMTYQMQYLDPGAGNWVTYDTKYGQVYGSGEGCGNNGGNGTSLALLGNSDWGFATDPRTSRFGLLYNGAATSNVPSPLNNDAPVPGNMAHPLPEPYNQSGIPDVGWVNTSNGVILTLRPDADSGFYSQSGWPNTIGTTSGWMADIGSNNSANQGIAPGLLSQNNTDIVYMPLSYFGINQGLLTQTPNYFADPDGMVRRAMGAFVPLSTGSSPQGVNGPADTTVGLPMAEAFIKPALTTTAITAYPSSASLNPYTSSVPTSQAESRPYFLHRPFYSVAELGYVFSDTPWRNLDFSTAESGNTALLDVFCINDTNDPGGLVAGKVNLNTRQTAVLQAVIGGGCFDPVQPNTTGSGTIGQIDSTTANLVAAALVARTTDTVAADIANGTGPLQNLSELVGKWVKNAAIQPAATTGTNQGVLRTFQGFHDGKLSYAGFSGGAWDVTNHKPLMSAPAEDVYTAFMNSTSFSTGSEHNGTQQTVAYIQRFRESPIRALAAAGTTRVWNLMIDVIAQTGRFPSSASNLANFNVEGERRYWVHVAIDRYTGKVLDEQVEEVKE